MSHTQQRAANLAAVRSRRLLVERLETRSLLSADGFDFTLSRSNHSPGDVSLDLHHDVGDSRSHSRDRDSQKRSNDSKSDRNNRSDKDPQHRKRDQRQRERVRDSRKSDRRKFDLGSKLNDPGSLQTPTFISQTPSRTNDDAPNVSAIATPRTPNLFSNIGMPDVVLVTTPTISFNGSNAVEQSKSDLPSDHSVHTPKDDSTAKNHSDAHQDASDKVSPPSSSDFQDVHSGSNSGTIAADYDEAITLTSIYEAGETDGEANVNVDFNVLRTQPSKLSGDELDSAIENLTRGVLSWLTELSEIRENSRALEEVIHKLSISAEDDADRILREDSIDLGHEKDVETDLDGAFNSMWLNLPEPPVWIDPEVLAADLVWPVSVGVDSKSEPWRSGIAFTQEIEILNPVLIDAQDCFEPAIASYANHQTNLEGSNEDSDGSNPWYGWGALFGVVLGAAFHLIRSRNAKIKQETAAPKRSRVSSAKS